MSTLQEYRNPLLIGAAGLVIAIVIYALVFSQQNSKLSSLDAQETTLQAKQQQLQTQLTGLQEKKQELPANCADLQKISTQIPSVQTPNDLAAEQSSFYNQLTALVNHSGTGIPTFAWTGSSATPVTSGATTPAGSGSSSGVVPVPVSMTITGTYSQMSSFVGGLDSFPRLFVIQTFILSFAAAAGASTPSTPAAAGAASANEASPALWTGGVTTPGTAGPYSLAITGSIYYTTTPNALAACNKATAVS